MKKLLILAMILPLAGCNLLGSDDDKKSPPVVVQPSDPVTPEEPPVEEEPVNETREEMIERELNLPPEPDKELDDSTVEGVDSNGNGVRDKHERDVAFEFYEDKTKLAIVNESLRLRREMMLNIDNIEKLLMTEELSVLVK